MLPLVPEKYVDGERLWKRGQFVLGHPCPVCFNAEDLWIDVPLILASDGLFRIQCGRCGLATDWCASESEAGHVWLAHWQLAQS